MKPAGTFCKSFYGIRGGFGLPEFHKIPDKIEKSNPRSALPVKLLSGCPPSVRYFRKVAVNLWADYTGPGEGISPTKIPYYAIRKE
ncbi:MAG: hypothetical protein B6245_08830 [Desulfobacteraceae bacterium 4572_88]|nr:MAG: hypothetical protein B6245_08830 [Desulfobacteraceae bacterium 4572_88]